MSDPLLALPPSTRRGLTLRSAVFAAALFAAGAGCSGAFGNASDSAFGGGPIGGDAGDLVTGADGGYALARDGAPDAPNAIVGSPLCNISHFPACLPDNERNTLCAPPSSDGGDAGGAGAFACHVREIASDGGTVVGPQCRPAGRSGDGQGCLKSDDCAGGYECVGSPGVCRHYCCDSKCGSGDEFCDIETDVDNLKVPVCALIKPCKALGPSTDCADGETCSIVTDTGATSCVTAGPAKVDQGCELTNCGPNLSCLGPLGARKCFALCDPTHPCRSGQKCLSSPPALFRQSGLGICQ